MGDPVRVAHVITRMIVGGAQELVLSIMKGLEGFGFQSVLYTGSESGPEGSLLPRARASGVEVVEVPALVRAPSPPRDLLAYRALRRAFQGGGFQVVNSYTSKAGFLGTLAARAAGVPVVVYSPQGHIFSKDGAIEGVSGRPLRRRCFLWLRRMASRRADALVALHGQDRDEQVALGLAPAAKFRVIQNGIDAGRFRRPAAGEAAALRRSLGIADHGPVIASVGRLAAEKGHADLIEAMARVAALKPSAVLLIIGDGPRRSDLEARARALGLHAVVRFLGLRADVAEILSQVDIFALASRYESFGLAILEAMAAAKPVVATRVGGIPLLVEDGETGWLVPPRSPGDLAEKIIDLATNPERARAMGQAGEARFRRSFSLEAMVRRVEALYRDLLSVKGVAV
jgi:glycosyltransferase involved in cell wall biosynthesis